MAIEMVDAFVIELPGLGGTAPEVVQTYKVRIRLWLANTTSEYDYTPQVFDQSGEPVDYAMFETAYRYQLGAGLDDILAEIAAEAAEEFNASESGECL